MFRKVQKVFKGRAIISIYEEISLFLYLFSPQGHVLHITAYTEIIKWLSFCRKGYWHKAVAAFDGLLPSGSRTNSALVMTGFDNWMINSKLMKKAKLTMKPYLHTKPLFLKKKVPHFLMIKVSDVKKSCSQESNDIL